MASFQIPHCVLISEMEFKYSLSKNRGRILVCILEMTGFRSLEKKTLLLSNWKERHVVSLHADIIAF